MFLHHGIHFISNRLIFAGIRQTQHSFLREVEAVHLVEYAHIERCSDVAILAVAMYMQVMVVAVEEQVFDQAFIAVEGKDDRFILCEKLIKLLVR